MNKTELLAPAGSFDALVAGIQGGANAVYLSGENFGARKFASNFSNDAIKEAIVYAHIRNVKVYVTVNTLIKDSEWPGLADYLDFLYVNDVDGIIVQDIGVFHYIKSNYPDLEIHGSTQMSAHHLNDFIFLKSIGFQRVVAGREMTLEAIREVKKKVDIEIEVFVHGALCVCYSGQCLMSSFIGGRSGNRGSCAQPCRQLYTLNDETSYTLSPRDLNVIDDLDDLVSAGIDSLKIEGRMKGPEYAWTVVKAYRNKLDHTKEDHHLNKIFNRGYTRGLLMRDKDWVDNHAPGNRGEYVGEVLSYDYKDKRLKLQLEKKLHKGDEIQIRREHTSVGSRVDFFYLNKQKVTDIGSQKSVEVAFKHPVKKGEKVYRTYDANWMKSVQEEVRKNLKIPVEMTLEIKIDRALKLSLKDQNNNELVVYSDHLGQRAINVPLDPERVHEQLKKLGQTPYDLINCQLDMDEGVTVAIKEINQLRRKAVEVLNDKRSKWYNRSRKKISFEPLPSKKPVMPKLAVSITKDDQRQGLEDLPVDIIYSNSHGDIPVLPRISSQAIDEAFASYKGEMLLSNLGQVGLYMGRPWIGNASLNVFNSPSLKFYKSINCQRMTLSYELSKKEILDLKTDLPLELIVYGRVPLLVTRYCPSIKATMACDQCLYPCSENRFLTDRFNEKYPLLKGESALEIFSHKPIHLMAYLEDFLPGPIDVFRLVFTTESKEEVRRITKAYLDFLENKTQTLKDIESHNHHFTKGVE